MRRSHFFLSLAILLGAGFFHFGGEYADAVLILLPASMVILFLGVIAIRVIAKVWHVLTRIPLVIPSIREVIHARANDPRRVPNTDRERQAGT